MTCIECDKEPECECFQFETEQGVYLLCSKKCNNKAARRYNFDTDYSFPDGHEATCLLGKVSFDKWKTTVYQLTAWQRVAEERGLELRNLKARVGGDHTK